jgi:branched-chain amino acid transport system ATP-binding protein
VTGHAADARQPVPAGRPDSLPGSPPVLAVRDLVAGYGDIRVIWGVSFDVHAGEVLALLGRNGAGKTTLLSALGGLLKGTKGTVTLSGTDVGGLPASARARRGLALVREGRRVFRKLTVHENLLVGQFAGAGRDLDRKATLDSVYADFPLLARRRNTRAGELSGGQQQILAIARAIVSRPACMLLDEPSAGLDPGILATTFGHLRALADSGTAILVAEQRVDAIMAIAEHGIVLEHGRLAQVMG